MSFIWRILRATIPCGKIFGTRLGFHWTCIPTAAFLVWRLAPLFSGPIWACADVAGFLMLVLLHEFGHVIAARIVSIATSSIVIWPLGGFAAVGPTARWRKQLPIAAGGPAINLLLGLILFVAGYNFRPTADFTLLCSHLFVINLVMLIFNLFPIWPLDGGRILVAILHGWLGIVRGRLAAHGVGIGLAAVAAPLLLYIHLFDMGAVLLLVILANVFGMAWPLGMMARERRYGFHDLARCPKCRSRALASPTGVCPDCGMNCNLFDNGTCWNCHASHPIACPYCSESAEYADWICATDHKLVPGVATMPIMAEQ